MNDSELSSRTYFTLMSRYRAGIIGLGYIGGADQVSGDAIGQQVIDLDGTHLHALARNDRVELVAGSSRDEGRRIRFTESTGIQPTYADWREMIEKEKLDIVSVATYAPFHAEITVACAEQGTRAIYCEKPTATTLPDAERMVQACDDADAILVINHNRRFMHSHRRLRALIADGAIGELTSCTLQWGAGRLGNVATHQFDALRMLTGREVEAVSGTLDSAGKPDCRGPQFNDPGGWGVLRLEGGLMCTVDAGDYSVAPFSNVINGTEGRVVIDGEGIRLEPWEGGTEQWPMRNEECSSMDVAVSEIVKSLDDDTPFSTPPAEAVRTFEAIVGFHASHRRNASWTDLPLAGEDRNIEVLSG